MKTPSAAGAEAARACAVSFVLALSLLGCERDDGTSPAIVPDPGAEEAEPDLVDVDAGAADPGTVDALERPPGDDSPLGRLETRMATAFVDELTHESWICNGEGRTIEYRLVVTADGTRLGTELDGAGEVTDASFGWAAIGEDTLLLDYPDVGRQVELGSILFADEHSLRANDAANGPLECRRQRYVDGTPTLDVAAVAAGDVDRDVEAAAVLAMRIETPRAAGGGPFDYWYCEIAGERAVGYVFEGEDEVGSRGVTFDPAGGNPGGADEGFRPPLDEATLATGRTFRWLATDGTTLLLVPLDADVAGGDKGIGATSLEAIVFPVEDAFTARRDDGALLQCLRDGDV